MRTKRRVSVILLAMTIALVAICIGRSRLVQGESTGLTGRVTSLLDDSPIPGALIQVGESRSTTNAQGDYVLHLAPGQHDVRVTAKGAIGMTITRQRVDGLTTLDIAMMPASPSPKDIELLDAKTRRLSQEVSAEERDLALERGYILSDVTQVPAQIRVLMPDDTVVVMAMDEYLKGVVPHEVPPYWPTESLKAQAVAARSYASTRHAHGDADVCTTVHCQVWSAVHYDTTDQAVDDTHGQAATYGGAIINAFFFGHCDGHTRNSEDVWGGYLDYCRAVSCPCGFDFMWGHGVGMCQEGARTMAEQGHGYAAILSHYYTGTQLSGSQSPTLSSPSLTPASGTDLDEYTYQVTYRSPLGDAPVAAHVIVNGRAQPLVRIGGDIENGWQYRAVLGLAPGEHTYQFYADDGYGHIVRWPENGVAQGPGVAASQPGDPTSTPAPRPLGDIEVEHAYASTELDWSKLTLDGLDIVSDGDGAARLAAGRSSGTATSQPISVPYAFTAAGATWHARGDVADEVELSVRVSQNGATWSAWQALAPASDGPARHALVQTELAFLAGHVVQWRATLTGTPGVSTLDNVHVACLNATDAGGATASEGLLDEPVVVSRVDWGADETLMLRPQEYRTPEASILYRTPRVDDAMAPGAVVRSLYAWDGVLRERGDVGCNYYVAGDGTIYEGRAGGEGVVGAHSGRYDYGSIGIALIDDGDPFPSSEALASLSRFLAFRCVDYAIDPHGQELFVDDALPTIMSACDVGLISCARDPLHVHLPAIRDMTLAETAHVPPTVSIAAPLDGEAVRAVVRSELAASVVVTHVSYYVDGDLRGTEESLPGSWRWNTTLEDDGPHELRVVVQNAAGQDQESITVQVDNTPPTGSISAPLWDDDFWVPITLDVEGAQEVQFCNGWVWEGEDLPHTAGSGASVADPRAANGMAWQALFGVNASGGWYGPYACGLQAWRNYDVYHRLLTPDNTLDVGLATLDIADDQGRRVYLEQPVSALDFPSSGAFDDFALRLEYEGQWPTCDSPGIDDGLEFRVWYSGAGDLSWDRVSVFTEPQPIESPYYWGVRDVEGQQRVLVRVLDEAGNALEQELLIGLDRLPPAWTEYGADWACVEDTGSGIDVDELWYAASPDDGAHWSGWVRMTEGISVHSANRVCLSLPSVTGTHVRFLARDVYGRQATSELLPIPLETPEPSATPTATVTTTPSHTPTDSETATVTPTPTITIKPTGSPTPDGSPTPGPTVPSIDPLLPPRAWLPLAIRR